MQKAQCFLYNNQIKNLAKKGESILKDLPHLPKDWINNIVKILPYLILIVGIVSAISGLQSLFAFNRNQTWIMHWMKINRSYYYITATFSIILAGLYLKAFKPLKNKSYEGWLLLFWAVILSTIQAIILFILGWGDLFGPIIACIFGFYLLYEVLPDFNNKEAQKSVITQEKNKKIK